MTTTGKRALITGITGQDGSYLAELLLSKGYEVHGLIRRSSSFNTRRLDSIYQDPHESGARLFLHYGDLTDGNNLAAIIRQVKPTEVYNLGAQSHVRVSFDSPIYTCDTVAMGAIKLLEAVRDYQDQTGYQIRYYQASSSEMFGDVQEVPQRETTPFYPRSPYGCAKVFAHWATINYRESYNLHANCGILFNHESPRRGETFVTRKITRAVGRIKLGMQKKLYLGNLDAQRDWGYAGDYVKAMWLMLQQDEPDDYVIATGKMIPVRQFCELSFGALDLDYNDFVEIDPRYYRPAEVEQLLGDPSKARKQLGWEPTTTVEELARMMVEADLELARREKTLRDAGHELPATVGHDQQDDALNVRYDVTFTGRVQGVYFRATTFEVARGFDVTGWVRNEPDGSVRLVAEGEPRELDAFIAAITGAKRDNVDDVRVERSAATGDFMEFEIRQ